MHAASHLLYAMVQSHGDVRGALGSQRLTAQARPQEPRALRGRAAALSQEPLPNGGASGGGVGASAGGGSADASGGGRAAASAGGRDASAGGARRGEGGSANPTAALLAAGDRQRRRSTSPCPPAEARSLCLGRGIHRHSPRPLAPRRPPLELPLWAPAFLVAPAAVPLPAPGPSGGASGGSLRAMGGGSLRAMGDHAKGDGNDGDGDGSGGDDGSGDGGAIPTPALHEVGDQQRRRQAPPCHHWSWAPRRAPQELPLSSPLVPTGHLAPLPRAPGPSGGARGGSLGGSLGGSQDGSLHASAGGSPGESLRASRAGGTSPSPAASPTWDRQRMRSCWSSWNW